MLSSSLLIISLTLLAVLGVTPARAADGGIAWQGWSETAFAQAKRENRFVRLDLGAVWCHWCHVMQRDTYGNPAVADLIGLAMSPFESTRTPGPTCHAGTRTMAGQPPWSSLPTDKRSSNCGAMCRPPA